MVEIDRLRQYWPFCICAQKLNIFRIISFYIVQCTLLVDINPNTEGVPAPHLTEGGGAHCAPPGNCSINGANELKFCVWEIPWPKTYNHVSGSRLSPRSKNPKISGILKFRYIFNFFSYRIDFQEPKDPSH